MGSGAGPQQNAGADGPSRNVKIRLTAEESPDVAAAAPRTGLTTTGYPGEIVVAAAALKTAA